MMAKYMAYWSKAYYAGGEVEIEADSEEQAYEIAFDNIGDYEGSMQYDPHGDLIEVIARAARKGE
jgi:hypothetical protein